MKTFIRKAVRELNAYSPGEQPQEPGLVKLNTNENAYPPSPKIKEAIQDATEKLRLYPDPVCSELRGELAKLHGCTSDQIFVGNGSDEVLALCVRAFVEKKGTVGYFEPSYSLYPVLAAIQESDTRPVRLNPDFSWTMPADYSASLFFLANPNAPTSILYPKSVVRDFCKSFPGVVLIDEAYVDFSSDHCMDLALSLGNVLVARSLSKSFSLAGLRLGYVVGSQDLIDAFYKIKDSYNVDRLAQQIALAAVRDISHMRRNVDRIKQTRGRIAAELEKRGFRVFPSETNFLWVKPPKLSASRMFSDLRGKKILVRHFPGELTGDYLRITVGTDEQMNQFLQAVDSLLS